MRFVVACITLTASGLLAISLLQLPGCLALIFGNTLLCTLCSGLGAGGQAPGLYQPLARVLVKGICVFKYPVQGLKKTPETLKNSCP